MDKNKAAGTGRQDRSPAATAGGNKGGTIPANGVVERVNEALSTFLHGIQSAQQEAQRPLVEANLAWARELGAASLQPNADVKSEKIQEFYRKWAEQWSHALSPERQQELQVSLLAAYRAYLRDIQSIWAQAEIESLPAPTLAGIGQSLSAAASYAAAYLH